MDKSVVQLAIQQRMANLVTEKAKAALRLREAENQAADAREALNILDGAIQDSQYWLNQVQQAEAPPPPKKRFVKPEVNGVAESRMGSPPVG